MNLFHWCCTVLSWLSLNWIELICYAVSQYLVLMLTDYINQLYFLYTSQLLYWFMPHRLGCWYTGPGAELPIDSHTDLLVECYAIKTDTLVDLMTTWLSSLIHWLMDHWQPGCGGCEKQALSETTQVWDFRRSSNQIQDKIQERRLYTVSNLLAL
jgi:hypothetical protein